MRVLGVTLRDFRGYEEATVAIGPGLTVVTGPNGAGKTNLLEALYFGCTGRSCRTTNEREVVRFGAPAARVVVRAEGAGGRRELAVGFEPGQPKRMRVDGAPVERMVDVPDRPLVSIFLPDRLELVKGPPALRRCVLRRLGLPRRIEVRLGGPGHLDGLGRRRAGVARGRRISARLVRREGRRALWP